MKDRFSEFDIVTDPTSDMFFVGHDPNGSNFKTLKSNMLINSSDITFLNGKGVRTPTTSGEFCHPSLAYNVSQGAYVAMITAVASTAPYAFFSRRMFVNNAGTLGYVPGVHGVGTASTGNVGTGEDTISTLTYLAGSLNDNVNGISGVIKNYTANNVTVKTGRLRVNGTLLANTTLTLTQNLQNRWGYVFKLYRTGASTQRIDGVAYQHNASNKIEANDFSTGLTLDETADIVLTATGEATNNNDVISWIKEQGFF